VTPNPSTPSVTNVVVCQGTNVTYTVTTEGEIPVSYQWRKNAVNLSNGGAYSGVTTSTLTITNATPAESGSYSVTVVFPITVPNNNGVSVTTCSETSTLVRDLTVNASPTCSISPTVDVCPNSTVTYSAPASMTTYGWTVTGSGTISGSTSSQNLTVVAANSCNSSYTLTLSVTDGNGCSSTCNQTINVIDVTAPTIGSAGAN